MYVCMYDGMVWYVRYGRVPYGTVSGMVWYGTVRYGNGNGNVNGNGMYVCVCNGMMVCTYVCNVM